MQVAYLCADPGVPVFGTKGASVHVQEIIRAFRARGADVRLYCVRTGDEVPADLADVPVTRIRLPASAEVGVAGRERAQAHLATTLAQQALRDGADLVYERYSLFSTALVAAAQAGVAGVLEVNAPLIQEQATHRELVDVTGAQRALEAQARAARAVACVSDPVAGWVQRQVPDAPVVVAANGVDTDRIRPAGRHCHPPVAVFVGTLKPWHGVDTLVRAAARARQGWRVRIVGDGPQGPNLSELAQRLRAPVDLVGAVAPSRVPELLHGAVCGVAPYPADAPGQAHYFSPLKLYEYLAAGLPVVASEVGQVADVVAHGRTGLLVPPQDPQALATAVDDLVADPDRATGMGAAGRSLVEREHSWHGVLARILHRAGDLERDGTPR